MSCPELQSQPHLETAEQVEDTRGGSDNHDRLNSTQECVGNAQQLAAVPKPREQPVGMTLTEWVESPGA